MGVGRYLRGGVACDARQSGGNGEEADSRWSRVMLRHEWEEEDGTDMRAHHVSDSRRGTSWLVERS